MHRRRYFMETNINDEWVVDITAMTCVNKNNNIVVVFEKFGKILIAKIRSIPLELVNIWTEENQIEKNINNTIKEAEDSFLKSYLGW
jgi:hypothetical protein